MSRYQIEPVTKRCQGFGACAVIAPGVFAVGAGRKVEIIDPHGAPDETILAAAKGCPYRAIALSEAADGSAVYPPARP